MHTTISTSHHKTDTETIGAQLATELAEGSILALEGDLGAGKTTLVQGLAKGLGIAGDIPSPTFTLMNVHTLPTPKNGIRQLVHIDAYRLEREEELVAIGVYDYLGQEGTLTVVEWPEKVPGVLKEFSVIRAHITAPTPTERTITIMHP